MVRPQDRKEVAAEVETTGAGSALSSAPKERAEFSATLCKNLTAHRTAAVGAALSQNSKVALVALLHTVVLSEREPHLSSPVRVRFDSNAHPTEAAASEYAETPAALALEQAEGWFDRLPGTPQALFDALMALSIADLLELLARFVGRAYNVVSEAPARSYRRGFDPASAIEGALYMDMADWWSPTAGRFLNHVPKAKMVQAVTEASGAEAARPIEGLHKAEAVAAAAVKLDGKRWLPSTLRAYEVPASVEENDAEDDADKDGSED